MKFRTPKIIGTLCYFLGVYTVHRTPRKINIEPENDDLEDDFPFPVVYSQVPAVNLPGCTI